MVGYEEKALCRKIANVFEMASKAGYSPYLVTSNWMESEAALNIYNKDFNDIAQSPVYLLNSLIKEDNNLTIEDTDSENSKYSDLMYWLGYVMTYFQFYYNIPPNDVWKSYDVMKFAAGYDVYHTLSSKVAVEECNSDYKIS